MDLDCFANFLSKIAVGGPSTAGIPADIKIKRSITRVSSRMALYRSRYELN